MNDVYTFFSIIVDGFKIPITIFGFTFSFWDVLLWGMVMSIVGLIVRSVING